MPPDGQRSEGTPSLSEGPDARGEPFFTYLFLAFEKKVSRRKGETLSRRYRRNGYAHDQKSRPAAKQPSRASPLPQGPITAQQKMPRSLDQGISV